MAEANLGSDVDFSWLEGMNLDPAVKEAVMSGINTNVSSKVKALHAGMTKAQQDASVAKKRAQDWDQWSGNPANKRTIEQWQDIAPIVNELGADGIKRALAIAQYAVQQQSNPQQQMQVQQRASMGRQQIREKFQNKEMTYEDMQRELGEVDAWVDNTLQNVTDLRHRYQTELPQFAQHVAAQNQHLAAKLQDVEARIARVTKVNQEIFPLSIKAMVYQREHPDRNVEQILETARNEGITDWDTAVRRTYGNDDFESMVNQRVAEKLAVEEENMKTRFAAQHNPEGSMGGAPLGVWSRKQARPVPTSDVQVKQAMADIFSRQP